MVSISVQPRRSSRRSISIVTPNAGRMTTSSLPSVSTRRRLVAEKTDAHVAELFVDVGVVDDFAGQVDRPVGKPLARLIGIVDGAIDAVAESELAREMEGQTAGAIGVVVGLDALDEVAVIALGQDAGDGSLEVEAFAEDE